MSLGEESLQEEREEEEEEEEAVEDLTPHPAGQCLYESNKLRVSHSTLQLRRLPKQRRPAALTTTCKKKSALFFNYENTNTPITSYV